MAEAPSTYFPDKKVMWGFRWMRGAKTDVEEAYPGNEQRRARYPIGGRRRFTGQLEPLAIADRETVREFLLNRRGRFQAFWFFVPMLNKYSAFKFGTGDGSTRQFTIPFKESTVVRIYDAGTKRIHTVQVGAGIGGEDKVTFERPSASPTVTLVTGGGSLSAGVYNYSCTFRDGTDVKDSQDGPVSGNITVAANDRITVGNLLDPSPVIPGVTTKALWRTVAGGSVRKFVQEVVLGVTSVTDGLADASLGTNAPPAAPPNGNALTIDLTSARERIVVRNESDDDLEEFLVTAATLGMYKIDLQELL